MSMEQAILELAGGMKELAAAVRSRADMYSANLVALTEATANVGTLMTSGNVTKPDVELEEAVTKVEKASKAETKQPNEKTVAAMEEARNISAEKSPAEDDNLISTDDKVLDYKADVTPVLLDVHKLKGRDALKDLLTKFDAKTGDKLKPEQYADIVAQAKAILAA